MFPLKTLAKSKILYLLSEEKILSVLKNPQKNPQETLLVVGILTTLLLVILLLIVLLTSFLFARRKKRKGKGVA